MEIKVQNTFNKPYLQSNQLNQSNFNNKTQTKFINKKLELKNQSHVSQVEQYIYPPKCCKQTSTTNKTMNPYTQIVYTKVRLIKQDYSIKLIKLIQRNKLGNTTFNKQSHKNFLTFLDKIEQEQIDKKIVIKLIDLMVETDENNNGILYMFTSWQKIEQFCMKIITQDNYRQIYVEVVKNNLMTVFTKFSNHKIPNKQMLKIILELKNYKAQLQRIMTGLNRQLSEFFLRQLQYLNKKLSKSQMKKLLTKMRYQKINIEKLLKSKTLKIKQISLFNYIVKKLQSRTRFFNIENQIKRRGITQYIQTNEQQIQLLSAYKQIGIHKQIECNAKQKIYKEQQENERTNKVDKSQSMIQNEVAQYININLRSILFFEDNQTQNNRSDYDFNFLRAE